MLVELGLVAHLVAFSFFSAAGKKRGEPEWCCIKKKRRGEKVSGQRFGSQGEKEGEKKKRRR